MIDLPRMLCVDDEVNILHAIKRSMRKRFIVHTAKNAGEGIAALEEEGEFQVVISDMKMPGMNGADFLRLVQQDFPGTVRILLTGYADLESVVVAVNEGCIHHIVPKPFSRVDLLEAIEDSLLRQEFTQLSV